MDRRLKQRFVLNRVVTNASTLPEEEERDIYIYSSIDTVEAVDRQKKALPKKRRALRTKDNQKS